MEPETIRILLVDSHDSVRLGLTTALGLVDDLRVIGEAPGGIEALRLCARLRPDVVLLELQLPDHDGIALLRLLRERCPCSRVVVLTSAAGAELRRRALAAGADDYLPKYVSRDELAAVIRAVATRDGTTEEQGGER
ncbi:MAG TPA: response regulator transcription factor [Thermomicrobiaceae bacterium]|nr:response regulator transcription factor [Thermomicrobiaceae bacterium]